MGTVVEAEVYVFGAGVLLLVLAILASIYRALRPASVYEVTMVPNGYGYQSPVYTQVTKRTDKKFIAAGILGILAIGASFIVALVNKRFPEYVRVVSAEPFALPLLMFQTESGYMDICPEGNCMSYCCKGPSGELWRDCSSACDSPINMGNKRATRTGANCFRRDDLQGYCKNTASFGARGVVFTGDNLCNSDPALGTITCSCCMGSDGSKFWDCQDGCGSHPTVTGVKISLSQCMPVDAAKPDIKVYCTRRSAID